MNNEDFNEHQFIASNTSNLENLSTHNNKISSFVEQIHSGKTLHLLAGVCQVVLGSLVIVLSLLGFIRLEWLSVSLNIFASVTTLVGVFFFSAILSIMESPG